MSKKTRNILNIFGVLFLIELISIFGYLIPNVRQVSFIVLAVLFLITSLINLRFGLLIIISELIIGSKGYLFYFETNGIIISIRIAFWLIIMSVWLAKFFISLSEQKKWKKYSLPFIFYLFFLILGWGIINGFINKNSLNNIFFDFNNWLYFALIFPFWNIFKNKQNDIWQVIIASLSWLIFKTYILLFIFSHNIPGTINMLYRWVRTTGIGEITLIQGGFYRIFFQSHIYILLAFFVILFFTAEAIKNKINTKELIIKHLSLLTILLSIILLCFSRSFWAGLIVGLFFSGIYLFWKYGWRTPGKTFGLIFASAILSIALIAIIVKFPYPNPLGGFSTTNLIKERAGQIYGEAAVSSRWNLLPKLWFEIKNSPIIGKGFGATVTYTSNDPRILEQDSTGAYTTYAFEWGWLDIWLKIGFIGIIIYMLFILKIIKFGLPALKNEQNLSIGLLLGIIVLITVHFFTPYLNHPLGIGFLIFSFLYFKK